MIDSLTPNNLAISRLVPSPRSTASTIRFRRSNEYAIALLKAISSTHSTANRCRFRCGDNKITDTRFIDSPTDLRVAAAMLYRLRFEIVFEYIFSWRMQSGESPVLVTRCVV